jgi:hypothetical protein
MVYHRVVNHHSALLIPLSKLSNNDNKVSKETIITSLTNNNLNNNLHI